MEKTCTVAVERAITAMWERYGEPLSVDEIADTAIMSKFYFSRVFRSVTGTSPRRFLSTIRLHRAKSLLAETSLTVTEISYQVGFNSLGTFTTRFKRSVGLTPTHFRTLARGGEPPFSPPETSGNGRSGAVRGTVVLAPNSPALRIYVGAFHSVVVEGMPVSCDILVCPADSCCVREYVLESVPAGRWYVCAAAVAMDRSENDPCPWSNPCYVGAGKPVVVRAGESIELRVLMRAAELTDLPILLALP